MICQYACHPGMSFRIAEFNLLFELFCQDIADDDVFGAEQDHLDGEMRRFERIIAMDVPVRVQRSGREGVATSSAAAMRAECMVWISLRTFDSHLLGRRADAGCGFPRPKVSEKDVCFRPRRAEGPKSWTVMIEEEGESDVRERERVELARGGGWLWSSFGLTDFQLLTQPI